MRCASCGFDNPTGAKFCEECGARLARACPACGSEVGPTAKFCGACGAPLGEVGAPPAAPIHYTPPHLAERILAEQAAMQARGAPEGERKTVTALFADLAASTELIHDLDPEDARRLIDPVLTLMMDAVHHYEGYVAKSMGDGILALFGAPIAHEDHPQRALYAALRMQEAMRRYADRIRLAQGVALQIRVGLNTGEVVVRAIRTDDLHTDYDPVGNSIHIAARMQSVAMPGSIVVSEHTHRLTEGYFEFNALGATPIKGLPEPLSVFEVLGLGPLRTRLQVAARRGLVRFVGRSRELEQLHQALAQARAGHGQIVGVVGEPGVGKSRLFHEFKLQSQRQGLVLETFSVSHGKAFPYLPLIELLKNYCQITAQDDERARREKLTGKVLTLDRALEDCLPYLFHLLGLSEAASPLASMDAAIRRRRSFEAIKRLLVRESLAQPLELIVEDLQWLDSETEAFLGFLGESVANARILLLVNYRPEYRHDWGGKTYYTQLRLDPLGPAEARELLMALLGEAAELKPLGALILAKTEGNPFFIEEVVQSLVEERMLQGGPGAYRLMLPAAPLALHLPTTVQGVLAARIDRLGAAEKALLQTLAVIGKAFPQSLLRAVAEQPDEGLHRGLARLQAGEFVYERPAFPEIEYSFKHALTQEVAYGSLLSERRAALHERTARAIEALFVPSLEDHCSELAHHYSRSGNAAKAVQYLECAGRQAMQRSAPAEAIEHFGAALEYVKALPETPMRSRHELALRIALGPALIATHGFAATEVEATYARAMELCDRVGDAPQRFSALLGLRTFFFVRGELLTACELGRQVLSLAEEAQDPALLVQAHRALGSTLFALGELGAAQTHFEQALAFYDPREHHVHAVLYGLEPGILALSYMAWNLWYLGYPERALERCRQALVLAREQPYPLVLADALAISAELHLYRRESELAQTQAEAAMTLSSEHGLPYFAAWSTLLAGRALVDQGRGDEGIARLREGLAALGGTGAELWLPYHLGLLAEAYARLGQTADGLNTLAEALAAVERRGARQHEAELQRLLGELTLARSGGTAAGPDAEAQSEACFHKALAIARRQAAKSLELRAATSLARLWSRQGKPADARQLLAGTYGWFTEGFDTADLQEARALLAELH